MKIWVELKERDKLIEIRMNAYVSFSKHSTALGTRLIQRALHSRNNLAATPEVLAYIILAAP
jgi:hypothetical protein